MVLGIERASAGRIPGPLTSAYRETHAIRRSRTQADSSPSWANHKGVRCIIFAQTASKSFDGVMAKDRSPPFLHRFVWRGGST